MMELEEGNHAPADHIDRRIASSVGFVEMNGVKVRIVRSDSAGYVAEVINGCERASRKFYVRADMDQAVREACGRIRDWAEYDVKVSKGKSCRREMGVTVHCMDRTDKAFTLVVKREVAREGDSAESMLPGLGVKDWKYWCIGTNEDVTTEPNGEGLTPAQVEENFNDHCDVENRIKQVKSDAGVGRLPTSELGANRVYAYIMATLHNLFELFKFECLPESYMNKRLSTVVRELLLAPGKVSIKGHRMVIDLAVYCKWMVELYQGILRVIREEVRTLERAAVPMSFGELIYRRE